VAGNESHDNDNEKDKDVQPVRPDDHDKDDDSERLPYLNWAAPMAGAEHPVRPRGLLGHETDGAGGGLGVQSASAVMESLANCGLNGQIRIDGQVTRSNVAPRDEDSWL
jgi:hypothetical protein